jgi:ethanolamine ammonia-lyase small subunit
MAASVPDGSLETATRGQGLLHTPARIALDRTGVSLTTRHALDFALAHAQARDAVHSALAVPTLLTALRARNLPALLVHSAAASRTEYLRRPDLGRTLSSASLDLLAQQPANSAQQTPNSAQQPANSAQQPPTSTQQPATSTQQPATITLILADGLSAVAADRHAVPLLDALLPLLTPEWQLTPMVIAEQARVALGDPIGEALHADATVILIGERPGLSSPDSLGAYVTWSPRPGRTDAERNCVSNIRPALPGQPSSQAGLDYAAAAARIAWYLNQGRRLGLTGVQIREQDTNPPALPTATPAAPEDTP